MSWKPIFYGQKWGTVLTAVNLLAGPSCHSLHIVRHSLHIVQGQLSHKAVIKRNFRSKIKWNDKITIWLSFHWLHMSDGPFSRNSTHLMLLPIVSTGIYNNLWCLSKIMGLITEIFHYTILTPSLLNILIATAILIINQSDYLTYLILKNSQTEWQTA